MNEPLPEHWERQLLETAHALLTGLQNITLGDRERLSVFLQKSSVFSRVRPFR